MKKLTGVKEMAVKGKKVLLRLDLDVPIENGKITDDSRLRAGMTTLNYLLSKGASVIVVGHLGRPVGVDPKFSLSPVVDWFQANMPKRFHAKKITLGEFPVWQMADNFFVLENIRFFPQEEENNIEFSRRLAHIADIYIDDAFAVSHRRHASIFGVAQFIPSGAGIQLQKEVKVLGGILRTPKRPLTVIIGGAKIETKLPLVEKMHHFADYVLVGGKIAKEVAVLLKVQHERLLKKRSLLLVADLTDLGTDITSTSTENFLQAIALSRTIVWNGPMGYIQPNDSHQSPVGTEKIAHGIIQSHAYKIVGGGDTIDFLKSEQLQKKFDFCSTGGGAMLAFLSGETLPGIAVLEK